MSTPIDRPAVSLVSYHSPATSTLGCSHYSRKCQVRAPCCPPDTFHPCRFCHDEQQDHKIDRHAISEMVCMLCCQRAADADKFFAARSQPIADICIDCSQPMARYWCAVCKFFDDEPDRDIFHCTACGICRRGKQDDFFHCDRCNCCYASTLRAGHKCIENVLSSVCPICLEDLFSSTLPVNFLRCGHAIHVSCLDSLLYQADQTTPWRCPTCKRTIASDPNVDAHIELYLRESPMPDEYSAWRAVILCNDCLKQAELPYHFAYHRCPDPQCLSFNTDVITIHRIARGSVEDLRRRRLPTAYTTARAAGLDVNSALQAGLQQIRDDDEEEDEVKEGDEDNEDGENEVELTDAAAARSDRNERQRSSRSAGLSDVDREGSVSDVGQVANDAGVITNGRDSDARSRWDD